MEAKYFKEDEFKCPCCGRIVVDEVLIGKLDSAREIAGTPFKLNSAYRCEKHNDEVRGTPASSHLKGRAVDINVNTSKDRYLVIEGLIRAGFTRIGIAKDFIHADVDFEKDKNVI